MQSRPYGILLWLFFMASLTTNAQDSLSFRLIDVHSIPLGTEFQGTVIGGLSSIDPSFDGNWYVISDDRSEYSDARFYKVAIDYTDKKITDIRFLTTYSLKDKDGVVYRKHSFDPEAIRVHAASKTLVYTSEGGRLPGTESPFIRRMDTTGTYLSTIPVPKQFDFYEGEKGLRGNGAFESISFENDSILWYANELPLKEDGPKPQLTESNAFIRLTKMNVNTGQALAQFAYKLDPIPDAPVPSDAFSINSAPEILVISDSTLLVMERAFSEGVGNTVRVFLVNTNNADDVMGLPALKEQMFKPVEKKMVLDFGWFDRRIDNVEGMTFGKVLPSGNLSFICVSDDNFNEGQETQFWLFEAGFIKKKPVDPGF